MPLAVLDEHDRLVGVIPRVTLLAALGPGTTATAELTLPLPPVATGEIDQLLAESEPHHADDVVADPEEVR